MSEHTDASETVDPDRATGASGPRLAPVLRRAGLILLVTALAWTVWSLWPSAEDVHVDPLVIVDAGPVAPPDEEAAVAGPIRVLIDRDAEDPGRVSGRPPPLIEDGGRRVDASEVDTLPHADDGESPYGWDPPPSGTLPELAPRTSETTYLGRLQRDLTGGRVAVSGGLGWIGSPTRWVAGVRSARRGNVPAAFAFEAPRHQREIGDFTVDLYEVSNAQYQLFLQRSARIDFFVRDRIKGNLEEIARQIVVLDVADNLDWENVTRQLYLTNIGPLHAAHPLRVITDEETRQVDQEATFQEFRRHRIRTGTALTFYVRAPPGHWPDDRSLPGEESHPVRFLSFEEAQAFAHWAGKHIPTEFEWEYVARGPKGLAYPWGGRSVGFEENVNGGERLSDGEEPLTLPFDTLPTGVSWVGCHHMLGNVSEWTTSFLEPYPGSKAKHPLQGVAVVVRGGSAADGDRLRVRSAFRGWRKPFTDPITDEVTDFAPIPTERRPWTGFRCAFYEEPGRSRTPEMHYLLGRERVIAPMALASERYAGTEAKELLLAGAAVEAGMFVPRRAFAVTCAPLWRIALASGATPPFTIDGAHKIRENSDLFEVADTQSPVLFGMIQSDFPIEGMITVQGASPETVPEKFIQARVPRGIYVVGMLHGRLALLTPDLRTVVYFHAEKSSSAQVRILKLEPRADELPAARAEQRVDTVGGRVWVVLETPLGGGAPDGHIVRVRFRYNTVRNLMRAVAMPWRIHQSR